ncbi:MAG TPA: redoxin family protein [Candidatus Xenobia bacterium]|nr:redoxin family protein [Candidatus Xenobia bacterium]
MKTFRVWMCLTLLSFCVLASSAGAEAEHYYIPLKIGAKLEWKRSAKKPGRLKVVEVQKRSDAERLGYRKGDEIIAIDGEPLGDKTLEAFTGLSLEAKGFRIRRKNEELELPVLFRITGFVTGSQTHALKPGRRPPELKAQTIAGEPVSLEQSSGKVVLTNFWATWCKPCLTEMPDLVRLQEKYGTERFVVLSINLDNSASVLKHYLEKHPLPFLIVHSPGMGSKIPSDFGVRALPTSILLDREGYVMQVSMGYRLEEQEGFLANAIETLIK